MPSRRPPATASCRADLARIAADAADIVSMQRGGSSKDVWVLAADRRATEDAGGAALAPRAPARHDELPSRLAENLFWLGRYSERCEDKARLLRATLGVRTDALVWPQALATCRRFIAMPKAGDATPPQFDEANALGLLADLKRLGWCAAQARSRLSAEHWRAISVLQRQFQDAADRGSEPRETLDALLLSLAALAGFALDDMTQDDGWRLTMLGRRLERLQFMSGIAVDAAQIRRLAAARASSEVAVGHRRQHHHLSHAVYRSAAAGIDHRSVGVRQDQPARIGLSVESHRVLAGANRGFARRVAGRFP